MCCMAITITPISSRKVSRCSRRLLPNINSISHHGPNKPKKSKNVAASVSTTGKYTQKAKTENTPKTSNTTKYTIMQDPNSSAPPFVSPKKSPNPEGIDLPDNVFDVSNTSKLTEVLLTSKKEDSTKSSSSSGKEDASVVPMIPSSMILTVWCSQHHWNSLSPLLITWCSIVDLEILKKAGRINVDKMQLIQLMHPEYQINNKNVGRNVLANAETCCCFLDNEDNKPSCINLQIRK
mmetsp:Transcript_17209/g.18906  ORF Transcript_17209/g.18906 Transcript_17209/m.18906 type:complete len:236 (-) Transcript_17209:511-1218(-)